MKQLNSNSIVVNDYQKGVLEKAHSQYLEHVPIKDDQTKKKAKVYCSRCTHYYVYIASNDSGYDRCRAVKIFREDGISRSSRDGDCDENKNNDCKSFSPRTESQLRWDKIKCIPWFMIFAGGAVGILLLAFIIIGLFFPELR